MGEPSSRATTRLYPLDPVIKEQLILKSFQDKFDIKDFISNISEKLIAQSQADPGPYDPKPFIRTFESVVDVLMGLRKEVQSKTESQEQAVRVAEKEYSKKLVDLNSGFESVGKSFNSMESKIGEVGRTAIRIGEQLESVHIARQRAQAAHDLVSYYSQFSKGDTSKVEALRKEGKEGRHQLAILLRRLSIVAKEVDLSVSERAREEIEKYCEKFEKDMLRMFDKSYKRGDPRTMAHCAQTLLDFNGGGSCVQIYVNQHDFFISKNRIQESNNIEGTHLWEVLPDPDATLPKKELGLADLFDEIRETVGQEAQIIRAVFPSPPGVMQVFLQRVFEQSIQQYLEQILNKASVISTLAFLRILQIAHIQTSALVEDLVKAYELVFTSSLSRTTVLSSLDSLDARDGRGMASALPIGLMLENAMEELFQPYTEGSKYLERESKNLGELYTGYLARFTKYHESMAKAKPSGGMLDRFVNQFSTSSPLGGTTTTTATSAFAKLSGMASSMKLGSLPTSSSATSTPPPSLPNQTPKMTNSLTEEDMPTEADGALSLDVAEKMLKWHAEAVGRCIELSSTSDVAKRAFSMLQLLAEALGTSYLETAIETAQSRLDSRDSRLEPDLTSLQVINSVDLICHLWQQYVGIALLPLASSSATIRREMIIFNSQTIGRVEAACNALEFKIMDLVTAYLGAQLLKQKKTDFKPRNDDMSFARVNTEPCIACCEILKKVGDAAKENLTGKNLETFLTEIGVSFHSLFLEHLKKFPVSATGGLMLAKDIKSYQDAIAAYGIPALDERFEFLRQLGSIYLLPPESLKQYITSDSLGKIDIRLLRPFLMQRSDWGQFPWDDDLKPEEGSGSRLGTALAETRRLQERFGMGKLTTMMEDLRTTSSSSASAKGTGGPQNQTSPRAGNAPLGYMPFGFTGIGLG
ncbi:Exocyst complex component 5 [Tulasnella sp. 419]|nr:Exocyst complex component 5 [Tulasnella sp. 418]KAG8961177.1 Exocyst complex component 5 [Tulasnella sp. 419]